jgi:hypothetical protein
LLLLQAYMPLRGLQHYLTGFSCLQSTFFFPLQFAIMARAPLLLLLQATLLLLPLLLELQLKAGSRLRHHSAFCSTCRSCSL